MNRDKMSSEKRSKIMSSIRSKNTKVELLLRSGLWKAGLRYRVHYKISGSPDIVFPRKKIAVFVDGDFWHGYEWAKLRRRLNSDFWITKIKNNRKRDRKVNKELIKLGWTVIHIWENELQKNLEKQINKIKKLVKR